METSRLENIYIALVAMTAAGPCVLRQCDEALEAATTTLEADGEALASARAAADAPLVGVIEFRMQGKLLWKLARTILQRYVDVVSK
jgi:hypothetical protein